MQPFLPSVFRRLFLCLLAWCIGRLVHPVHSSVSFGEVEVDCSVDSFSRSVGRSFGLFVHSLIPFIRFGSIEVKCLCVQSFGRSLVGSIIH